MIKSLFVTLFLIGSLSLMAYAEDAPSAVNAEPTTPAATPEMPAIVEEAAAPAADPATTAVALAEDAALVDNLEFVSGEVSAVDEASKAVSVRLYGENEDAASEKVLKVTIDENTDITDGEQDRDLKSLVSGVEVDIEYDPTSNKATYIFVY